MTFTVQVANLSPKTTTQALRDFFTFCGTITTIDHNAGSKSATISFEKAQAAKTALMLNSGTLDGSSIQVTSEQVHPDHPDSASGGPGYEQSDKPRAGIVAEYLAKGYIVSDQLIQRAIEMDKQQHISERFLAYWKDLEARTGLGAKVAGAAAGVRERASSIDEERGISKQAADYYSRAISTEWGKKVVAFYTDTSKQVADVHEEARRIAAEQKAATTAPVS